MNSSWLVRAPTQCWGPPRGRSLKSRSPALQSLGPRRALFCGPMVKTCATLQCPLHSHTVYWVYVGIPQRGVIQLPVRLLKQRVPRPESSKERNQIDVSISIYLSIYLSIYVSIYLSIYQEGIFSRSLRLLQHPGAFAKLFLAGSTCKCAWIVRQRMAQASQLKSSCGGWLKLLIPKWGAAK